MRHLIIIASLNALSLFAALPASAEDASPNDASVDAGTFNDAGSSDSTDVSLSTEQTLSTSGIATSGELDASGGTTDDDSDASATFSDAPLSTQVADASLGDAGDASLGDAGDAAVADAEATSGSGSSSSSAGATSGAPAPRPKILPDDGNLSCSVSWAANERTSPLAFIMLVGAVWFTRRWVAGVSARDQGART